MGRDSEQHIQVMLYPFGNGGCKDGIRLLHSVPPALNLVDQSGGTVGRLERSGIGGRSRLDIRTDGRQSTDAMVKLVNKLHGQ